MDELNANHIVVEKPADCFSICGASASLGRLSTTLATLSLMSFAALSKFISVLNSIFIVLLPFSEFESIFFIPSEPPITSSSTCVTSWSIISADADL